jgi:MoxR-like ATPase
LAQALARVLGIECNRVQFTSDLLPADIIGASIFNAQEQRFQFKPGPIFTPLLLADEINRATPKAQSALLEAMEERQVSIDGETLPLPEPFFVIATQNPHSQMGTFALPESQLDRFLMRIELGYPDNQAERQLLRGQNPRHRLVQLACKLPLSQLQSLQLKVDQIHLSEPLLDYVQRLVNFSRQVTSLRSGCHREDRWHWCAVRAPGHCSRDVIMSPPKMSSRYWLPWPSIA